MKSKSIFRSFRFEIVLCSLLSILYTILTESGILLLIYGVYQVFEKRTPEPVQSLPEDNVYNFALQNNVVNRPETQAGAGEERELFLVVAAIVAATSVLLFTMYFLLLTKKYTRYLETIQRGIAEFAEGNFESRIEAKSEDEFGQIAEKLNGMAEKIQGILDAERTMEARKNELITNVAHDLKTPLTSIVGYLELVSEKELTEETRRQYTEIAYEKTKRLEKLIEDLFTYTKMSLKAVVPQKTLVELRKLLEQLIEEFYPSLREQELTCEFICTESNTSIYADGNMLARAFANLLGNAVKYGAHGKKIQVTLIKKKNYVIEVRNYGELIPPEALAHVFERFYRVENSRSAETGGSGLGLAIAKSIFELHGGTIQARSNESGTTFTVTLPREVAFGEDGREETK